MKPVAKGEPLLPALTAEWYNHTLRPHTTTPREKRGRRRDVDELVAQFLPGSTTEINRFDPVGLETRVDTISDYASRIHYCSAEALTKYNWIIPQLKMTEATPTQPCVYFGVTYANVLITNSSHKFVDLDEDTKKLVSSNSGRGQILVGAGVSEEPQVIFINISNYVGASGSRLVQFEMTSSSHADFSELDDTFIENAPLLDITNIGDDVVTTGWIGLAILQDDEYYFINARCNQGDSS